MMFKVEEPPPHDPAPWELANNFVWDAESRNSFSRRQLEKKITSYMWPTRGWPALPALARTHSSNNNYQTSQRDWQFSVIRFFFCKRLTLRMEIIFLQKQWLERKKTVFQKLFAGMIRLPQQNRLDVHWHGSENGKFLICYNWFRIYF